MYTLIKPHLGGLVLSLSLIISSLILVSNKITLLHTEDYLAHEKRMKISNLPGETLRIHTNSNDVQFNSQLTVGAGSTLFVQLTAQSSPVTGKDIVATFYHVSRLLMVQYTNSKGEPVFLYYSNPVAWGMQPQ